MRKANITEYSIFDVEYEPKFKMSKCENTSFVFKVNINDNYFMDVSIKKLEDEKNLQDADSLKVVPENDVKPSTTE